MDVLKILHLQSFYFPGVNEGKMSKEYPKDKNRLGQRELRVLSAKIRQSFVSVEDDTIPCFSSPEKIPFYKDALRMA